MKVWLSLICLLFLTALMDGDAVRTVRRKEGQNIKFGFKATFGGRVKLFCKGDCKKTILVRTTGHRAHSGRYGIEYQNFSDGTAVLNVSISDVKQSDTGRYQCALHSPDGPFQYSDFHLVVTGASSTSDTNSNLETFTFLLSTSGTTTAATSKKLNPFILPTIQQKAVKLKDETEVLLYVGLSVAFMSIVFQAALKYYRWKKRSHQEKDSAEETESDDISQINPEREETKKDRQNNSSAEEISSV